VNAPRRHSRAALTQGRLLGRHFAASFVLALVVAGLLAASASAKETDAFKSSFGAAGHGAGQLELTEHSAVAINLTSGDTYVADTGNHRIDEFSSAGSFVRAFGADVGGAGVNVCTTTCAEGTSTSEPGGFESPTFVAVDNSSGPSKGDVYVADPAAKAVSKFTAAGTLVSSWGNGGKLTGTPILATGTGTTTAASNVITEFATLTGTFAPGQTLTGKGISPAAIVSEVTPTELHFSGEATESATGVSLSARFPFQELAGIAVDTSGNLWVYDVEANMYEFGQDGTYTKHWNSGRGVTPAGIAIDSEGNLYVATGAVGVTEFTPEGHEIGDIQDSYSNITGLAIDPATDDLYVDDAGTRIRRYSPSCEPASGECKPEAVFGSSEPAGGELQAAGGIAIAAGHSPYVADSGKQRIDVFTPITTAGATTGPAFVIDSGSATLTGTVDPSGIAVEECSFEWGLTEAPYEHTAPCESPNAAELGNGTSPVPVHAKVTGLSLGSTYHFRLAAKNANGTDRGEDKSFTVLAPSIDSTTVSGVTTTEATVHAFINPGGVAATYHVEYVSEEQFEASGFAEATSTPESESVGSQASNHLTCVPFEEELFGCVPDTAVSSVITDLTPGTAYRYRVVAHSGVKTTDGPTELLYAYPGTSTSECPNETLRSENNSLNLPNCRAYELVSPANSSAEIYVPDSQGATSSAFALKSSFAARAAANGEAAVYVADPPPTGGNGALGNGSGNQYMATREQTGWKANVITPTAAFPGGSAAQAGYQVFSEDLSKQIFYSYGSRGGEVPPLTPDAPNCRMLYLHTGSEGDSGYSPLFTETQESKSVARENCGSPFFAGASSDYSQLFFQTEAALSPGTQRASEPQIERGRCSQGCNLYESVDSELHPVDVFNEGAFASGGATFGAAGIERQDRPDLSGVISGDGSHAFWTDSETGIVYLRLNPAQPQSKLDGEGNCTEAGKACTVQVSSGAARYWTATPDGRYAYYTENEELWRFDSQNESRLALAGPGSGVQGVVGVNETGEDGAYLYFVASGALGTGAESRTCEPAGGNEEEEGHLPNGFGCNLYLLHNGEAKFLTALSARDNTSYNTGPLNTSGVLAGDWVPDLGSRTAEVTPDGHSLVFQSILHLTGSGGSVPTSSIYNYDADTNRLACVSCVPSGSLPEHEYPRERDTNLPVSFLPTFMRRWISSDGSRIFFTTEQALSPLDENGKADVYEWEREGSSGCAKGSPLNGGGCVRLISAGTGTEHSLLLEMSASGNDVFFISRDPLVPGTGKGQMRLFDARVNGGFPAGQSTAPCESPEACHASGTQAPGARTPGSSTFQANEESPPASKCKKGRVKRRGHCVKKGRHAKKKSHKHKKRAGHSKGGGK
jgi:hypothetical protein